MTKNFFTQVADLTLFTVRFGRAAFKPPYELGGVWVIETGFAGHCSTHPRA